MKTLKAYPPNFDQIVAAIPGATHEGIVFTYGDTCYNPSGEEIQDHLEAHEQVHMNQQAEVGAEEWWTEYLKNPKFRLEQEVEAYRAQYKFVNKTYGRGEGTFILKQVAIDLASPMYGSILNRKQARKAILGT